MNQNQPSTHYGQSYLQQPSNPATQSTKTTDSKETSFLSRIIACFSFRETSTNRASQSTPTHTSEKKFTILSYLFAPLKRGYLFYPSAKSVNQVLKEAIDNPTQEAIDKATSYLYDFIQHEISGKEVNKIVNLLKTKIKQDDYPQLHSFINSQEFKNVILVENTLFRLIKLRQQMTVFLEKKGRNEQS